MKALDIGAGLGKCMIALEKAGFDSYGLEASKPFYERAISKMSIDTGKIKLGAVEELDYPDNFFDFITYGAVFEHLYHPAAILDKSLKWLKRDGIIHIEVPSADWLLAKLINLYYELIGTNYVTNLSPMHVPFHLYEFSLKSFERLAERIGFSILQYHYDVCDLSPFPRAFYPLLKRIMAKTNTGMQLTVYIKKL